MSGLVRYWVCDGDTTTTGGTVKGTGAHFFLLVDCLHWKVTRSIVQVAIAPDT